MALQQNNLMLLEIDPLSADYGLPRTMSNTDTIGLSGDLVVGGDLTVDGDIVSVGTRDVVITDNFIDLNNGNISSARSGGLTVNVQATANQALSATSVEFRSQATTGGDATFAMAGIDPSTLGFAVNDIIEISGFSDAGENNGLFIVASITGGAGGAVAVKAASNAQATTPFAQNDFEDATEVGPATAVLGWALDLGVITISDGTLPADATNTTQIAKGSFATAFAASATDQLGSLIYGDAASVSLQEAYDEGSTIVLNGVAGDLDITTLGGVAPQNFKLLSAAGAGWIQTDEANTMMVLGDGTPATPRLLNLAGNVNSDIVFHDAGVPTSYFIQTASTDALDIEAGSANFFTSATGVDKGLGISSQGAGFTASVQAANLYASGASLAGDLNMTHRDITGTETSFTITFTAAAADITALIAGATISAAGTALVQLVDVGGRLLIITTDAGLVNIGFSEAVVGLAASLGFANSNENSDGLASVQVDSQGDFQVVAANNVGMTALNESLRLKVQGAGKELHLENIAGPVEAEAGTSITLSGATTASLTAGSGALTASGASTNISSTAGSISISSLGGGVDVDVDAGFSFDLDAGAGGNVRIGNSTPAATSIAATTFTGSTSSTYGLTVGSTYAMASTGAASFKTDAGITIGASTAAGGSINLDAMGTGGAAANSEVIFRGFMAQDLAGAGMGMKLANGTGAGSVAGDIVAMQNNGAGLAEVILADATSANARNIMGMFAEGAVAAGDPAQVHTAQGMAAVLSYTGAAPGAADIGKPVYLSQVAGKATLTAPVASGDHVVRLGYVLDPAVNSVVWAPQFIAKRP